MCEARLAAAVLLLVAPAACPWAAPGPLIPATPAAGSGAVTLFIHSGVALPYSLMDLKGVTERLLSRVDARIVTRSADSVRDNDVRGADYVVLLGIEPWPDTGFLRAINPAKPLLVCGLPPACAAAWPGGSAFRKFPPGVESWPSSSISIGASVFETDVPWLVAAKPSPGSADGGMLAEVRSGGRMAPLAWRSGKTFWFASLPIGDSLGFALSGILPAFFGVEDAGRGGIVLAIEDLDTRCDPATVRRVADLLAARDIPFVAAVQMPGADADAAKAHAFVSALQYAQARRGRIFLIPQAGHLWDVASDRPPSEPDVDASLSALRKDFIRALENGLLPVGMRLPDSGLAKSAAVRIGEMFSLGLATAQASDGTAAATFSAGTITRAAPSFAIIPVSPWFQPDRAGSVSIARNLLRMPGTVLHVAVPGWQTFQGARKIIDVAVALDAPFIDVADAAASVSTDRGALWTAAMENFTPGFSGRAVLSCYDTRSQPVSSREIDVRPGTPFGKEDAAIYTLIPCKQP